MKTTIAIAVALMAGCVAQDAEDTNTAGLGQAEVDCQLEFMGGNFHWIQTVLHCSEAYAFWVNGQSGASLVAYCPDATGNRARLTIQHIEFAVPGNYGCYEVPTGQLLTVVGTIPGPGCPGGCYPDG
jgi:hypothetical protein